MSETPKFTPGPWTVVIDDTGGQWTGWPISIAAANEEDKSIVRPGGQWPYEWDAAMSQREAIANAHLIAAAPELYGEGRASARTMEDVADALGERGLLDLADELRARARSVREVLLKAEGLK